MTQDTGAFHARWLFAIGAAAVAFAGATIAAASDSRDDAGNGEDVQVIKIVRIGEDGRKHGKGSYHEHQITLVEQCDGQKPQVDESEEVTGKDGKVRKSRVVICTRGGEVHSARALEALERAREKLSGVDELSDAAKARALASIDEQIARLRAQQYPLQ